MPQITDPDGLSQGGVTSVAATTFAGLSVNDITITSVNVPAVTAGDYIEVRSAANAANNGLYRVVTYTAATSIVATKQSLFGAVTAPANDAGSATIRIFGTNAEKKNVHFDTANRRFTFLNGYGSVTVLDNAGVLFQAFYSFCKEEWKNDNDLIKFPFPLTAITPEQFEFNEWRPVDASASTIVTTQPSDTRSLLRSGGWSEINAAGFTLSSYFCWITLGNIDPGDFAYYFFASETASTPAKFAGPVNEAVPIIVGGITGTFTFAATTITRSTGSFVTDGFKVGDYVLVQNALASANDGRYLITAVSSTVLTTTGLTGSAGDTQALLAIDRRSIQFTTRIRVFGKTYDQSSSTAIGLSVIGNQAYRFPLSEATDNVINALVTTTLSNLFIDIITTPISPWNDMSIAYFAAPQTRVGFNAIGGDSPSPGNTQFGVIIDGDVSVVTENGGGVATAEQIYAYVQAKLTAVTNINNGAGGAAVTVIGQLAAPLLSLASVGNSMASLSQTTNPGGAGGNGVKVDSFASDDTNRVAFRDNDADLRSFPFVASGRINFNANLSIDVDAVYRVLFTNDDAGTNLGRDFGTIGAITVKNTLTADIAGAVPQLGGGSFITFDFDYDGNVQRGAGSAGTNAPITIVAIGLTTGQYVVATGTIARATGQSFTLVSSLERNYSNPI